MGFELDASVPTFGISPQPQSSTIFLPACFMELMTVREFKRVAKIFFSVEFVSLLEGHIRNTTKNLANPNVLELGLNVRDECKRVETDVTGHKHCTSFGGVLTNVLCLSCLRNSNNRKRIL
ncbi:hypothetical protein LXL04_038808 [Taraxacum kok-saghyz]